MKKPSLRGLALASLFLASACARSDNTDALPSTGHAPPDATGFAVVELFTSESCSSCPPAERLLNEIDRQAQAQGTPVFALAFHVDYWNYLHWHDRFSDAAYTQRQRRYANQVFGTNRIYTPQMIVNGKHGFVGHDQPKAKRYIQEGLSTPADTRLAIQWPKEVNSDDHADHADQTRVPIRIHWEQPWQGLLNIAVTEDGLSTSVSSGENRGRRLTHRGVVRRFQQLSIPIDQRSATVVLELPEQLIRGQSQIVAYAQDAESFRVLGAVRSSLPEHGGSR